VSVDYLQYLPKPLLGDLVPISGFRSLERILSQCAGFHRVRRCLFGAILANSSIWNLPAFPIPRAGCNLGVRSHTIPVVQLVERLPRSAAHR